MTRIDQQWLMWMGAGAAGTEIGIVVERAIRSPAPETPACAELTLIGMAVGCATALALDSYRGRRPR